MLAIPDGQKEDLKDSSGDLPPFWTFRNPGRCALLVVWGGFSLASSPFQGRNSQKGSQLKKAAYSCWNIQKITEHHQCTIFNFGYDRNQSYNPGTPKKNSHMSHYSESIFFQSRCAATQLNRNKPIKASGICGSQGHWRRKSWWEKRSRGNPPLPIRNPHSMPKMLDRVRRSSSSLCSGGLASHVSKFITAVAFAIGRQQTPRSKTLAVLQTLAASQGNLVIKAFI